MTVPVPPVLPDSPMTVPQLRYKFAPRSLVGFGQADMIGPSVDLPGYSDSTGAGFDYSPYNPSPGVTPGSASGATPAWLSQLIGGGLDIVKLTTLPAGVVVQTPGGTLLRQAPGLPVPATVIGGTGVLGANANLSTGAGLAIAAVLGIGALVLIMGRR